MNPVQVIPIPVDPLAIVVAHVVRDRRSILVDTGWAGSEVAIVERLERVGIDPASLAMILVTHGHLDHFGAAGALRERFGVPVAIHWADADSLRRAANPPFRATGPAGRILQPFLHERRIERTKAFEPDILLADEMRLDRFGVAATVVPTPGHTGGCVSVLTDPGDAIVGDLIMGGLILRRRPGLPLYADDIPQLLESVRALLARSPRLIRCSHGGPFRAEIVQRWLDATS